MHDKRRTNRCDRQSAEAGRDFEACGLSCEIVQ
jgi:hypothetical protein